MQPIIRNPISGDVISTETELIDTTTIGPHYIPDKNWQYTDHNGHKHFYSETEDNYPTLQYRHWSYFCHECHEQHEESKQVCKLCGETITPGVKPDPKHPGCAKEYIQSPTSYYLNNGEISKEEAERILEKWQAHGETR